jgi:predicted dehydrogenase
MPKEIRIAVIGLDTSHSVELPRLLQAPGTARDPAMDGLRVTRCLRFETPFQNKEGLDGRQKELEPWGIKVTERFDEAIADCDALMIEINDPARHLEYVRMCAGLGKPIFLDKPLADTMAAGEQVLAELKKHGTRVFSASSLRFVPQLEDACRAIPQPAAATVYGPLGRAPSGSSIVWYGVHAFEMLQRAMGPGATTVFAHKDTGGAVAIVAYGDGRRGVVELSDGVWIYGGTIRSKEKAAPFAVDTGTLYRDLLVRIAAFFRGGETPVPLDATREIMGMLDAAERSSTSGKEEKV